MNTFFEDIQNENLTINYNGDDIPIAYWNLVKAKMDISLWCKFGIVPHRHGKISDVKKYFELSGTRANLYDRFIEKYGRFLGKQS